MSFSISSQADGVDLLGAPGSQRVQTRDQDHPVGGAVDELLERAEGGPALWADRILSMPRALRLEFENHGPVSREIVPAAGAEL